MINAWSLLYEELNGTMDKTYPVENNELNGEDIVINTGTGDTIFNVPSDVNDLDDDIEHSDAWYDYTRNDPDRENPFTDPKDRARADRVVGKTDDVITVTGGDFVNFDLGVGNTAYVDTLDLDFGSYSDPVVGGADVITFGDGYPSEFTALSDNDDSIAHLIDKPVSSGIEDNSTRKYKEDESIEALKNYISTTYGGHYTSDNNSVQTLDLIESVGDAESFCRSNAIKYLSRYDKKGQAKRDILKALHYSLLLYHFSGQLNETPTRGYETF